jgi:hypothetical protein
MNLTLTARLNHDTSDSADDSVILQINTFALWYENAPPLLCFFLKIEKDNNILKILKSVAMIHKHPIYTLESSKHPLNLVRLSL